MVKTRLKTSVCPKQFLIFYIMRKTEKLYFQVLPKVLKINDEARVITEAEARRLGILPESNTRKVRAFDSNLSDYTNINDFIPDILSKH